MSVSAGVLMALGSGLAKWLAKRYLGESSQELVGELIDFGKEKIPDLIERRNAARQFERYADDILKRLLQSLETRRKKHPELDDDAICRELTETINGRITEHYLIAKDLDPRVIAADLRQRRPLPAGRLPDLETRVYEQVLDEIVRYILEVASLLPSFQPAVAAESLKRLSNLGQDVSDVLNTVQRLEARAVESAHKGPDARWEADYRAAVIRSLDRVELFGADIPPEAQRNLLTEAFVSLNVDAEQDDEDMQSAGSVAEAETPRSGGLVTVEELFQRGEQGSLRALIRGSAGCGKTTLLRWAAIEAAKKAKQFVFSSFVIRSGRETYFAPPIDSQTGEFAEFPSRWLEQGSKDKPVSRYWQERIPFFVPLRNCQDGTLPTPDDLPLLIAKEVGRPPAGWVRTVLAEGRALVMLDGVDEVPAQNRERLRNEIGAITEAYPQNYFVLTSRPTAIPEYWLQELGFLNADVSPMSMPDVERFVKRWHEATGKELARQGRADANLATDAERLVEQFNQNPPLSLLATNPLLCAMICALHRVRHHKLPESQYELCETLCHMLLHKRERESHLNWQEFPAAYIALTYEQKRGIAQQLAQWLVHNGQSAMPLEVAYEQVARALQRIPGRTPDEAPLILKTLVERSGLLREPNPEVVDFLHNTFKELLAGDDLAVRGDAESVVQHLDDESWRRVALFGVASPRSQTFADALVTRVLDHIRRMGTPEFHHSYEQLLAKDGPREDVLYSGFGNDVISGDDGSVAWYESAAVCDFNRCEHGSDMLDRIGSDLKIDDAEQAVVGSTEPDSVVHDSGSVDLRIGDIGNVNGTTDADHSKLNAWTHDVVFNWGNNQISGQDASDSLVGNVGNDRLRSMSGNVTPMCVSGSDQVENEVPSSDVSGFTIDARRSSVIVKTSGTDTYLKAACSKDKLLLRTVLFALQCRRVAAGTFLEQQLATEVDKLVAVPFPPADFESAEAIAQLGDDAIPLLIAPKKLTAKQAAATARALRLINTAKSRAEIERRFIDSKDWDVIAELALVIHPLTIPAVIEAVQYWDRLPDSIRPLIRDASPLASLTSLERLDLDDTGLIDVKPLAGLTRLQWVELKNTAVIDVGPLARLTSLQRINLDGTRVTDLSPLAGLTNLLSLFLNASGVTDLAPLSAMTKLERLDLEGTRVTDVSPLARMRNLLILELSHTAVIDLSPLAGLTNLQVLWLSGTDVTDVSPLAGLTNLERLELDRTGVTDISPLAGLTRLQLLELDHTDVTDVSPLAGLTSLRRLFLRGTGVTDLSPLEHLTELKIYRFEERSDENAEEVAAQCIERAQQAVEPANLQLTRLDVANWRGFEWRTFEYSERVTVLIGNNGTGKSSSLEALAVGLAGWCGGRVIEATDARRVTAWDAATPRVSTSDRVAVRCAARWDDTHFDWLREWKEPGPQTEALDAWWAAAQKAKRQLADGVNVLLPVLAYYPASRNWRDVRFDTQETQPPGSPWDGYSGCLNPAADVRELKRFMKTRQWFALQEKRPAHDLEAVQQAVLAAIGRTEFARDGDGTRGRPSTGHGSDGSGTTGTAGTNEFGSDGTDEIAVADGVMPVPVRTASGVTTTASDETHASLPSHESQSHSTHSHPAARVNRFEYDVQMDELMIGFDDGRRLPFGMLSDGQRTTIALVADIARRAATLNPHFGADAASKAPGIVLIDEIELHLHPRWQRTIVGDLRETFPLMQFVITTHSPFIVQSCRPGEVYSFECSVDGNPQAMSIEDIVEYYMGQEMPQRSQRMLDMKAAAERYYATLRDADSVTPEERERLKRDLDRLEEPFTDEPAFSAFLRLKRAAAGLDG